MNIWWGNDPDERYWMEITRRDDLGANLLAPKVDHVGHENPKYVLFIHASDGDVVFHYDALQEAIVAYSVVDGAPLSTTMRWEARGSSARARNAGAQTVDAWELALRGYTVLPSAVTRPEIIAVRDDVLALRSELEQRHRRSLYFPFTPYRDGLRAAQSYITKMPRDFALLMPGTAAVVQSVEGSVGIEVAEAREAVERAARPGRRQRRQASPEVRTAVELHAMQIATARYESLGWTVDDVSRTESYDLLCSKSEQELHVEVKGTQSKGEAVLLTPNEVAHAQGESNCALFVVAEVIVDNTVDPPEVSGGRSVVHDPWDIAQGTLKPVGYEYWLQPT